MLDDPPILTLRRDFQHPGRSLIARLAGAQTGHIVDALKGTARSTITTGRSIGVNELPAHQRVWRQRRPALRGWRR